jgi:hypothetical protein
MGKVPSMADANPGHRMQGEAEEQNISSKWVPVGLESNKMYLFLDYD